MFIININKCGFLKTKFELKIWSIDHDFWPNSSWAYRQMHWYDPYVTIMLLLVAVHLILEVKTYKPSTAWFQLWSTWEACL